MSVTAEKLPTREEFSTQLNKVFRANIEGADDCDMVLIEAKSLVSNDLQESFSLLFRAPVDAAPAQSIYSMDSSQLGKMDLFLVPVKKDDKGMYFEAIFNHLLDG